MSHCDTIVIDEFDTFVDSGNEDNIRRLLDNHLGRNPKNQVVFASATVSKHMSAMAQEYFGDDSTWDTP